MTKTVIAIIIACSILYLIGAIITFRFLNKKSKLSDELSGIGNSWVDELIALFLLPIIAIILFLNLMAAIIWPLYWTYYLLYWLIKKVPPEI